MMVDLLQNEPCDPGFDDTGPFVDVRAPDAWDVTTGSTRVTLAIVDNGYDLRNPDMLANYAINQGELLDVLFFDVDGDGVVTQEELLQFDVDGDGLITFVDLNAPANAGLCGGPGLSCDFDGDGVITPLDLVDGDEDTLYGFETGSDGDENGFDDDLVGWDFDLGNNLPHVFQEPGANVHGLGVASLIAAVGAPQPPEGEICASQGIAGMNWVTRLVPIKAFDEGTSAIRRGLEYAARIGADAVNVSIGVAYGSDSIVGCPEDAGEHHLGSRKFEMLSERYELFIEQAQMGETLIVAAAVNCPANLDDPGVSQWLIGVDHPNIIGVGAALTGSDPVRLWSSSAFGEGDVNIAAPSTNVTRLLMSDGVNVPTTTLGAGGGSSATPLVTGALGLILAADPDVQGNGMQLRERLLCNATTEPGLEGLVTDGNFLDAFAAVTNAMSCP